MNRDQFYFYWQEQLRLARFKWLAIREHYRGKPGRRPRILTEINLADADQCRALPALRLVQINQLLDKFWEERI